MKVERSMQLNADPQAVRELVMDPDRLGDWVSIHQHLEDSPNGQLRKGSQLTQCLKLAGQRFRVTWKVTENTPEKVVWEGKGPVRSRARVVYEFEAKDGGTCFNYMNEYNLPGGPVGRMAGPAVRRVTGGELDKSLKNLKGLFE
ncbi:MAG TPA: SRPBCC family protein [Thermoleophilaceae bacterium]|nr:SRPBCC family protein [Thermoleophilaceae bacterium]